MNQLTISKDMSLEALREYVERTEDAKISLDSAELIRGELVRCFDGNEISAIRKVLWKLVDAVLDGDFCAVPL